MRREGERFVLGHYCLYVWLALHSDKGLTIFLPSCCSQPAFAVGIEVGRINRLALIVPGNEERGRLHGHEGGIPGRLGLLSAFKCNVSFVGVPSSSSAVREEPALQVRESCTRRKDCKNLDRKSVGHSTWGIESERRAMFERELRVGFCKAGELAIHCCAHGT